MMLQDVHGHELTGATEVAAAHFERGTHELRCFIGDPVASADRAIAAAPDFVMAHALKGYLYGLSTEAGAQPVVEACHAAASRVAATPRERGHVAALGHLAQGRWHEAGKVLADLADAYPRDALALQAGHQVDFFTGNAPMLRARIEKALPHWDETLPGYHALLGMHAFGLEENADYAAAESAGRRAVDLEPRDGWAQHAVAHVMEMQCRQQDGIAWMRENTEKWTKDSFLQVHNWWHLALFHYELGETDAIFELFDGPIYGSGSTIALNMVDASALLWRLHLGGVDVGDRWQTLADNWLPFARSTNYAFNDMHAMMAFVAAGRDEAAAALLETQTAVMAAGGDNAAFTRDVGHPATRAIRAFGRGDYAECVRLILPVRAIAHTFGGSHAQRDVLELTLLEAALRGGDMALGHRLALERAAARPSSPLSRLFVSRGNSAPTPS